MKNYKLVNNCRLCNSKKIEEEFINGFKILREQTYGISKIFFGEIST